MDCPNRGTVPFPEVQKLPSLSPVQFFHKYEEVKLENGRLREANKAYKIDLGISRSELAAVKATVDKYKTADAKNRRYVCIQWNLQTKDTLGVSIVERMSSSQRFRVLLLWE